MRKIIILNIIVCMHTMLHAEISVQEMNTFSKNLTQNAKSYPGKNAFVYKSPNSTPIKSTTSATGQAISIQAKNQEAAMNYAASIARVAPTTPSSPANNQIEKAGRGSILGIKSPSISEASSASITGLSGSNQASTIQLPTKGSSASNSSLTVTNQSPSTSSTGRSRSILQR